MMDLSLLASPNSRKTRVGLGRRLSRRLSLVTRVPNLLGEKIRAEFSKDSSAQSRKFEVTVIAPDKTQRIVSMHIISNFL